MTDHGAEGLLTPSAFSATGPLPTGVSVLEASAGTGKTYAIAALAARYVAEGVAELGELMMVTFGRMATDELRLRVRERLADAERALLAATQAPAGQVLPSTDTVTAHLVAAGPEELRRRHGRIVAALADFDAATIATTHEFSAAMLAGLGILGESEPDAVFVESLTDLAHEVATDCYLRRFAGRAEAPQLGYPEALALAQRVVAAGHTRLVPELPTDASPAPARRPPWVDRVAFAHDVRSETNRRKELGRLYSYEDMLTRLQRSLTDPEHGQAAADRLRARFKVVLVDEFQDTDPIQWDILRTAFAGHRTLVLIGDPKQAIYAFRGADVFSYLDAVEESHRATHGRLETLSTNWRSDAPLVAAIDGLLGGAALGSPKIVARTVQAQHGAARLTAAGGAAAAPLRLRVIANDPDLTKLPPVATQRRKVTSDLVTQVGQLLGSGAQLTPDGEPARVVRPSDVAVLVHTNKTGERIQQALVEAGIPAVMLGSASVFNSESAREWAVLLQALEQPRSGRIRDAALTSFLGWTLPQLTAGDDDAITDLTQTLRTWSRVLVGRGVAALVEVITSQTDLSGRLLAVGGGERRLTDLRHIGQLLHHEAVSHQLGPAALLDWLRERVAEASAATMTDRTRRLETQAEAVSILTVHRSKGLEFPVVYAPELWDRWVPDEDNDNVLTLHEVGPGGRSECVLDVGGASAPGRAERVRVHRDESAGEDLRLAYVALTRAQCQVVAWWAPSKNTETSALQRLLYGAQGPGLMPRPHRVDGDPMALVQLGGLGIVTERVDRSAPERARGAMSPTGASDTGAGGAVFDPGGNAGAVTDADGGLDVRRFGRSLDLDWRRTSYSSLTAAAHGVETGGAGVGSEDDASSADDEAVGTDGLGPERPGDDTTDPVTDDGLAADATTSPMAYLPGGTQFGTVVHHVLETVQSDSADLAGDVERAAAGLLSRGPASELTAASLAAGLLPSMRTPLGPLAGDVSLSSIESSDRLAELDFELPLAGGDLARVSSGRGTLADVAALLRRHLRADDPLADYPDRLDHPLLADQTLRGYLTGSIDAVLRLRPDPDAEQRFLVVDYKTNVLGAGLIGAPVADEVDADRLTIAGYRPDRLATAMMAAHYPLQALLYSVALHRYLRWRLPGYDPETHLGGVLYLFLRGMTGPEPPRRGDVPYGVFSWRPSAALVTDLSDLLDGSLRPPARAATATPVDPHPRPGEPTAASHRGASR